MDTILFLVLIFLAYELLRAYTLSRRSGFKFYLLHAAIWIAGSFVTCILLFGVYTSGWTTSGCWSMIGALLPSVVMGSIASKFREREIAKIQVSAPAWRKWENALQDTTWIRRALLQYPDVRNLTLADTGPVRRHKVARREYTTSGYLKNYTAQMRALAPELGTEKIKAATEDILRRAESKPVFCFGAITRSDAQMLLFEIAAGMSKDALADLLKALETKLPLQLARVGYGWVITGSEDQSTTSQISHLRNDPYAKAKPQSEARKVYPFDGRGLKRYSLGIGLLLVSLAILIARSYLGISSDASFVLNLIGSLGLMIFLVMLGEGSLWPWSHVSRVVCDQEGLEIKYWLKPAPARLAWTQISGLDVLSEQWSIYSNGRSLRLLASEAFGLSEGPTLVKTLVQRASLYFVEVNMALIIYKRFDAPE